MKSVTVTSPTRIDLAGGTLDLWPLYTLLDGAVTVNFAIDIFTTVTLERLDGPQIIIDLKNVKFHKTFKNIDELFKNKSEEVAFIKPHLKYWRPNYGIKISVHSESPVGGGLGGSSSVTAGLCKAFAILNNQSPTDYEFVELAHNIEAQILHKLTGTQDYVPAIRGGLNYIRYNMNNLKFETEKFPHGILEDHGFLVYTGQPHNSGLNNWDVLKKSIAADKNTMLCLQKLQSVAYDMEATFRTKKWSELKTLFDLEYKWRVKLSKGFSSPKIEKIKKIVSKNGAVKICGAGGGGCVFVWCTNQNKNEVLEKCQKEGFQVFKIKAVENGFKVQTN